MSPVDVARVEFPSEGLEVSKVLARIIVNCSPVVIRPPSISGPLGAREPRHDTQYHAHGTAAREPGTRARRDRRGPRRAGREPGGVTLVAVTKGTPPELIVPLVEAGARDLGENYPRNSGGNTKRWPRPPSAGIS